MSTGAETERERSGEALTHGLTIIRERWWIVALSALICLGLALALSLTREDVYESTASVQFANSQVTDSILNIDRASAQPERDAATQVLVATSSDVADLAARQLRAPSGGDLLEDVTVETEENANVLSITAEAGDPRRAAAIANAFAGQFIAFNRRSDLQQLDASARSLEARRVALPEGTPERESIDQQLAVIQAARGASANGLRVIGTAEPPSRRTSPAPRRDAVLGLILGLVLGLALALLVDLLDRRVKTVAQFEALYRTRVLAAIPQVSFTAQSQHDRAVGFEPYRVLRNALGFAELSGDLDAIMVTSAMPSEGKSSVSLNLARAMALSGQRVVLVECDLRRPSLARTLGLTDPGGGLTTALVARRPVAELLRPVVAGIPNFSVLPSGPLPPNAAELLRSPRMAAVLSELTETGARLIIDAPPLLPVADAQGLLDHPQISAAIVVARLNQTTRDEARRTRAVLDGHRLQPIGVVVTGVREEATYGYYGVDPGGVPRGEAVAATPPEREPTGTTRVG